MKCGGHVCKLEEKMRLPACMLTCLIITTCLRGFECMHQRACLCVGLRVTGISDLQVAASRAASVTAGFEAQSVQLCLLLLAPSTQVELETPPSSKSCSCSPS